MQFQTNVLSRMLRLAGTVALVTMSGAALADGHVYNIDNPTYREECGSCHVAYPPQLLGTASWKSVMDGLAKHFGSDASLGEKPARDISAYLAANASRRDRFGGVTQRITETRWFRHEHGEEISPAVWKNPKVKSAANCEACHIQAGQGDYSERTLRVPRG